MLLRIIYLVGLFLYSIFEGKTEGLTWEYQNGVFPLEPSQYHLFRTCETIGVATMIASANFMASSTIRQILLLPLSFLLGFLIYRITFIHVRGQTQISPPWQWTIKIPLTKKILRLYYPHEANIIIAGSISLLLLILIK